MLRSRIALFPNPSARNRERRWIANALREAWNRAAETVGVRVRMYEGTKHSSATAWLAQGSSRQMIQRMLRHADARSTERLPLTVHPDDTPILAWRCRGPGSWSPTSFR